MEADPRTAQRQERLMDVGLLLVTDRQSPILATCGAKTNAGGFKSVRDRPTTTSKRGRKTPSKRGCPAESLDVLSTHAEDRADA
jgi:hypothetical protein